MHSVEAQTGTRPTKSLGSRPAKSPVLGLLPNSVTQDT